MKWLNSLNETSKILKRNLILWCLSLKNNNYFLNTWKYSCIILSNIFLQSSTENISHSKYWERLSHSWFAYNELIHNSVVLCQTMNKYLFVCTCVVDFWLQWLYWTGISCCNSCKERPRKMMMMMMIFSWNSNLMSFLLSTGSVCIVH